MMLTIDAPQQRDGVGQALADALGIDVRDVALIGDELHIANADGREADAVAFAAAYVPVPVPAPVPLQAQIDELRGRLDRAANAAVTGEAAKLRDNLRAPP